jgi:hypothetical protein
MAHATRAPKVASEAVSIPKLEDSPEFVAERDRLRSIANELDALEEQHRSRTSTLARLNAAHGKEIDEGVRARLDGKQAPVRSALSEELGAVDFRRSVLREALFRQSERFEAARSVAIAAVLKKAAPRDRELVRNVIEKAEALADALDEALAFRHVLIRQGLMLGTWPHLQSFADKIGSRKRWASAVNDLGRCSAAHISRPWDSSRVQY